jgi:hypothetical protein
MIHTLIQMINYTIKKKILQQHYYFPDDVNIYFTFISFVKVKAT